jgi:hypothetical protein
LISASEGGFHADRNPQLSDWFGASVSGLGDLNEDGVPDIAVGAPYDESGIESPDRAGAIYILYLNSDGTVQSHRRITLAELPGESQHDEGRFGTQIVRLGDVDGDGVSDLGVGESFWPYPPPGTIWILFMNRDGSVKDHGKISERVGGFNVDLAQAANFGSS